MAYTDSQYNALSLINLVGTPNNPITLGTATGAGTASNSMAANTNTATNGTYLFPTFRIPTKVLALRVFCGTAVSTGGTTLTATFLNGTNTVGTATIGSMTAGQWLTVAVASDTFGSTGALTSPTIFAAGGQFSMNAIGTITASGGLLGTYAIQAETTPWFVT